jgi:hypothetical protein
MKLYVAYCHDRHVEPEVRVFTDRTTAIEYAKQFMHWSMAHPEGIVAGDEDGHPIEGYEAYFSYKYESDHAFVVAVELDAAPDEWFERPSVESSAR